MAVLGGEAEAAGRALLGVELDQHRLLVADDPGVVAGLDGDELRSDELERAPVRVLALDVAAREGVTLCDLLLAGLRTETERRAQTRSGHRYKARPGEAVNDLELQDAAPATPSRLSD